MRIPELTWPVLDPDAYDEDLLLDIVVGRVTLLIRGRNAWRGTWVRNYLRNATLYTDPTSAKAGAEAQRQRGSVFYVVEAPAIQLKGMRNNVVLCDAHPSNPFGAFAGFDGPIQESPHGAWRGGLFPGVSVRDASEAFAHDSGHWIQPLPHEASLRSGRLASSEALESTNAPYVSLTSSPRGSGYLLDWIASAHRRNYTDTGAIAVARRWWEMLAAIGIDDISSDVVPQRLRAYREDDLRVLPKGRWQRLEEDEMRRKRTETERARSAWLEMSKSLQSMRSLLLLAEFELDEAREDRMHPAETAAGMRLQRERVVAAEAEVRELKECVKADTLAVIRLRQAYRELSQ